jgi:ubiquinone/menaquinone biosynthesis C-methylase UbiE
MPISSSRTASKARSIQTYYDAFAPFYDSFYEQIDYSAWAKIIQRQLDDWLPVPRRILDVGCGTGAIIEHMLKQAGQSCVGLDLSRGMLQRCQRRLGFDQDLKLVQGDILSSCFRGNTFDAIIGSFGLLNLYPAAARKIVLQEISRILQPAGIFLADFATVHRYHQLVAEAQAGQETSYVETAFKIQQSFIPNTEDHSALDPECLDRYVIERTLFLQGYSVRQRFYFLDPQQIKRELLSAGFQIVKITPILPDNSALQNESNRLMLVGRKP